MSSFVTRRIVVALDEVINSDEEDFLAIVRNRFLDEGADSPECDVDDMTYWITGLGPEPNTIALDVSGEILLPVGVRHEAPGEAPARSGSGDEVTRRVSVAVADMIACDDAEFETLLDDAFLVVYQGENTDHHKDKICGKTAYTVVGVGSVPNTILLDVTCHVKRHVKVPTICHRCNKLVSNDWLFDHTSFGRVRFCSSCLIMAGTSHLLLRGFDPFTKSENTSESFDQA